jgi:hypothetical protein
MPFKKIDTHLKVFFSPLVLLARLILPYLRFKKPYSTIKRFQQQA